MGGGERVTQRHRESEGAWGSFEHARLCSHRKLQSLHPLRCAGVLVFGLGFREGVGWERAVCVRGGKWGRGVTQCICYFLSFPRVNTGHTRAITASRGDSVRSGHCPTLARCRLPSEVCCSPSQTGTCTPASRALSVMGSVIS